MYRKVEHILIMIIAVFTIAGAATLACLANSPKYYLQEVNRIKTNKKVLMLTFDDGPGTEDKAILDILDKYDIKATFFQVGFNDARALDKDVEKKYPGQKYDATLEPLMERMIREGHWIGAHTFTHSRYIGRINKLVNEVDDQYKLLKGFYKEKMGISLQNEDIPFRFPHLQFPRGADVLRTKFGINYAVGGYIGTDYREEKTGAEKILKQYETHLSPGQILVAHSKNYAKVWLETLIKYCIDQGYTFVGMNPLPQWKKYYYGNVGTLL